jgi:DNA-binding response OmpR family regulator
MLNHLSLYGIRILLVEDDCLVGMDVADGLRKMGAEVVGPLSACADAIAALAEEEISAAILDVNLEGFASFPVARKLVSQHVPFVWATGCDPTTFPDHCDAAPLVQKPYQIDALAKEIISVVRRGSTHGTATGHPARSRQQRKTAPYEFFTPSDITRFAV